MKRNMTITAREKKSTIVMGSEKYTKENQKWKKNSWHQCATSTL
jgi:hypothetical protein